ncbi:DUF3238 domain-containing protein [Bacillus licheniformis]|nr:DUF3238 domain-containing protein [Bacillus licheniformis]
MLIYTSNVKGGDFLNKKVLVGLTSMALVFSAQTAFAKGGELETEIISNENTITLDWNDTGDKYEVYSDGKLLWKGTDSKYVHKNLKPRSPQEYDIVSYENGKRKDMVSVDTTTLPEQRISTQDVSDEDMPDPLKAEEHIDSTINDNVLTLNLRGKIQDDFDGKIEVYKDDELIDNNAGTTFVDDKVESGKTYVYKFVVLKKLSPAEIEKVNEEFEKRNQKLSFDQFKDYYYRPYEYIKAIKVPEQKENLNSLAWEPPVGPHPNQMGIKYRTFIPTKYAPAASIFSGWIGGDKFGGDNRSFSFSGGSHRTQTEAVARFTSSGSSTYFRKDVNYTRLYDKDGNFKKQQKPTDKNITFTQGKKDKSMNYFVIKHAATVGFNDFGWTTPAIDYTAGVVIYKSGRITVSGTRDQAPSHEMYAYIPYSDAMITLFKASNKGFEYLFPPMPSAKMNIDIKP